MSDQGKRKVNIVGALSFAALVTTGVLDFIGTVDRGGDVKGAAEGAFERTKKRAKAVKQAKLDAKAKTKSVKDDIAQMKRDVEG